MYAPGSPPTSFTKAVTSSSDGAAITATGSVGVTADERMTLNVVAGNISGGGSAAVGAAVSVPVVSKETHAWIGNYAKVKATGNSVSVVSRSPNCRQAWALAPSEPSMLSGSPTTMR